MTKNTTTSPRLPTDAWEKSKELGIKLSVVEGKRVAAGEANRRAVELAIRNIDVMIADAMNKRRNNEK